MAELAILGQFIQPAAARCFIASLRLVTGVELRALSSLPDVPVPAFAGEPLMLGA